MIMPEMWKDIRAYENRYQASTLGNIKSLERKVLHINGVVTTVRKKILKEFTNHKGYCLIALYINNKHHTCTVHRLIIGTFKGESELEVNHINGIKTDNRLINLEYVTYRENINHRELMINGKKKYGVYFHKAAGRWAVKIEFKRNQQHLGLFANKEDAHQAFYNAYLNLHGVAPW